MLYKKTALPVEGVPSPADVTLYIQDFSAEMLVQERGMVILCPGGGYNHLSVREAESEALQFLAMGYHAAVLHYSVSPVVYPTQLVELAMAVRIIREHAEEWHIRKDAVIVQGSSAGGHLAGCLGMFWQEDWLIKAAGAKNALEIRPDGLLLCYPVITTGEYAHKGSFAKLLGISEEEVLAGKNPLLEKLSLEKQVNSSTPRTFIWHTFSDGSVPVENSLLLVEALRKKQISTEFHMYPKGQHGLALASPLTASSDGSHRQKECESWILLAKEWLSK